MTPWGQRASHFLLRYQGLQQELQEGRISRAASTTMPGFAEEERARMAVDERDRATVAKKQCSSNGDDQGPWHLAFGIRHSAATNRVLTVLLEKEVELSLVAVNSFAGESKKSEHLALHTFGQVPVLQDGDFTLFESRAIIRYICERFPSQGTPNLYGFTYADKARVEQWLEVESQVLQLLLRPRVKQLLGPRIWNTQNVDPDGKIVAEHTQKLAKILDVYEVQLSKQKYLAGDFVSIADLSHLPMTYYYFCLAKQQHLLTARTHVAAWFDAISTRPSWRKVLLLSLPNGQHDVGSMQVILVT